jgi:hypothetical protein
MSQCFAKNLIDLPHLRPATKRMPELPLNHRKDRLDIGPLMIMQHEVILMFIVES